MQLLKNTHPPTSSAETSEWLDLYRRLSSVFARACHGVSFNFTFEELQVTYKNLLRNQNKLQKLSQL